MVNIIKPEFLKWNSNNSVEHFDMSIDPTSWENGAETFFQVFNKEVFCLCTYSSVKKDYQLETEGVNIRRQEQKSTEYPPFEDDDPIPKQHEIDIEWTITEPKGHVFITLDDKRVGIEWADRRIKDLQGNEARLIQSKSEPYRVEEILTSDEHDTLIEIKRLARLRDMSTGELRQNLNRRMTSISR